METLAIILRVLIVAWVVRSIWKWYKEPENRSLGLGSHANRTYPKSINTKYHEERAKKFEEQRAKELLSKRACHTHSYTRKEK